MLRLLFLFVGLTGQPAAASERPISVGFMPSVAFSLGSATDELSAQWDTGFAYTVPLRVELHPNVALRAEWSGIVTTGSDRLFWDEVYDGATVAYYVDVDAAYLITLGAFVGPELTLSQKETGVFPTFGVGVGARNVQTHHEIAGEAAAHIRQYNHTEGTDIRPYTSQLVPAAQAFVGGVWRSSGSLALRAEIGYTVSFVEARPLVGANSTAVVARGAYGLRMLRLGVGASMRF
jgi:hypothetical protein